MRSFFSILLKILSFGILPLIRWLAKKKLIKDHYSIDIDSDGISDVHIHLSHDLPDSDDKKEEL